LSTSVEEYLFVRHSWNSPLEFSIKWKTNILAAIRKGEQRSALLTLPMRKLKLDLRAPTIATCNYLKRYMYHSTASIWGLPYWQDATELTSQALSGQAVLQVGSTQCRNFEVGGLCVVLVSWSSYEVGTILSKTDSSITLTGICYLRGQKRQKCIRF